MYASLLRNDVFFRVFIVWPFLDAYRWTLTRAPPQYGTIWHNRQAPIRHAVENRNGSHSPDSCPTGGTPERNRSTLRNACDAPATPIVGR